MPIDGWNDPKFCRLFLMLLSYPLSGRQIKYLIWRFYNNKRNKEIIELDGKNISQSAVNRVITKAYRKIKVNFRKS